MEYGWVQEKDIEVGCGVKALPGTLALPAEKGFTAGIVLVHGSGPQDRDETIGGTKPFRDLAEGLAARGIATLRYDKRTFHFAARYKKQKELSGYADITPDEEVVDDAIAAVDAMQDVIPSGKVFLLGHSFGGVMAPAIAARAPRVRGIVIMAGAVTPIEDIVRRQIAYLRTVYGNNNKPQLDEWKQQWDELEKVKSSGAPNARTHAMGASLRYWKRLDELNPRHTVPAIICPTLVLQGERDYQVTMQEFELWKDILPESSASFISYPALNHLFIEGTGPSVPEEYRRKGNIPPYVIDDIARWIKTL